MLVESLTLLTPEEMLKAPFVVRGHHIHGFVDLHRELFKPTKESLSNFYQYGIEAEPERINFDHVLTTMMVRLHREFANEKDSNYVYDVLGKSSSNETFFKSCEDQLRKYASLAGETPTIITDSRDKICLGCAVGDHCRVQAKRRFFSKKKTQITEDNKVIFRFHYWLAREHMDVEVLAQEAVHERVVLHAIKTTLSDLRHFIHKHRDIMFIF